MSDIIDDLRRLGSARPAALYIRHAERPQITDMDTANDVLLTTGGKHAAMELGTRLARQGRVSLWHSPVDRCRQTAECILEGVLQTGGEGELFGAAGFLGGPYLVDADRAIELAWDLGADFVPAWFAGRLDRGLVMPVAEAGEQQLTGVLSALAEAASGLVILVTHDWNILLARRAWLGVGCDDGPWPSFLNGLALARGGAGTRVSSLGTTGVIASPGSPLVRLR